MEPTTKTQAMNARRAAVEQGLASTRIEGHVPSAEFLADCERYIAGTATDEELLQASLARARALEGRSGS